MTSEGTGMRSPISVDLARNVDVNETWRFVTGEEVDTDVQHLGAKRRLGERWRQESPVTGSSRAVVSWLVYLCFPEVQLQI